MLQTEQKSFIELNGADTNRPWMVAFPNISDVFPASALSPEKRAEFGIPKNCKCVVNTFSGTHFQAKESYEQVKEMIVAATKVIMQTPCYFMECHLYDGSAPVVIATTDISHFEPLLSFDPPTRVIGTQIYLRAGAQEKGISVKEKYEDIAALLHAERLPLP